MLLRFVSKNVTVEGWEITVEGWEITVSGIPKWMVKIMEILIKHGMIWGGKTPLFLETPNQQYIYIHKLSALLLGC